jgi:hypothetical protein
MGQVTLPAVFGIAPGYLVAAVVLMAAAGFAGAERIEAMFRRKA